NHPEHVSDRSLLERPNQERTVRGVRAAVGRPRAPLPNHPRQVAGTRAAVRRTLVPRTRPLSVSRRETRDARWIDTPAGWTGTANPRGRFAGRSALPSRSLPASG